MTAFNAVINNLQLTIYKNFKLVIAGKKGWLYQSIFEKVKKLGLEDRVIFTDFVPEEDKPALITGAKVFVLPSFGKDLGWTHLTPWLAEFLLWPQMSGACLRW